MLPIVKSAKISEKEKSVSLPEKILFVLQEQPNLTIEQLADMLSEKPDSVQKALKRMWSKKQVEPTPMPSLTWRGRVYFWKIKGAKARLSEQSYKHHYLGSQLYAALRKTGKQFEWFHTDDAKDRRWDRAMNWQGVWMPIEVHRGTQKIEVVIEKAEHYAKQKNCRPIWTVSDYQPNPLSEVVKTAKQTGQEILDALRQSGVVTQPLVTPHAIFIKDPLAPVLVSPRNRAYSLLEIASESISV